MRVFTLLMHVCAVSTLELTRIKCVYLSVSLISDYRLCIRQVFEVMICGSVKC